MKVGNCLIHSIYSYFRRGLKGKIVLYRGTKSRAGFTFVHRLNNFEYYYKSYPKRNGKWYWFKGKIIKKQIK